MKWLVFAYDAAILAMVVLTLPLTLPLLVLAVLLFPRRFPALTHRFESGCRCRQCVFIASRSDLYGAGR